MLSEFEIRKALAFFPTIFPFIHLVVPCYFPIEYIDLCNILHIVRMRKEDMLYYHFFSWDFKPTFRGMICVCNFMDDFLI